MTDTAGVEAPHWTASQNQPDVTVNESFDIFDATIALQKVIDFASDADRDITDGASAKPREWQHAVIEMTDTGVVLTGAVNVIVPDNPKIYFFYNNTLQTLTLKTSAGSGVAVATTKRAILQCDGTDVVAWSADF